MNGRQLYSAAGILIVGFMLLLFYAFTQLVEVQRQINADVGEDMLWAMSQTARAAQRLDEAVHGVALGEMEREEMLLRIDLLHSRLALLTERPQADYFARIGIASAIARQTRVLARLDAVIEPAPGDPAAARALLAPMLEDLQRMTTDTMVAERETKGAQRDQHAWTVYLTMAAFAGLVLVAELLSWQLVSNMRAAQKAGNELRRHKEQLEAAVVKRTAELQAALETERRTKEIYRVFITTVSHQFRTPLSIIDMIAQRLARRPQEFVADALVEKARRIRRAARRLTRLVESTTIAASMDQGEVAVNLVPADLNRTVREAITYQTELTPERQVCLMVSEVPLMCRCDAVLIEQVVLNLLSNAVKYSEPDSVIEVLTGQGAGHVFCSVRDVGVGIPQAEQAWVFARFFRGNNVVSIQGAGLGLNMSRTLVELQGGELTFDSCEGAGSTFTFTLPELQEVT
jgi:signal transduction histidine kinase